MRKRWNGQPSVTPFLFLAQRMLSLYDGDPATGGGGGTATVEIPKDLDPKVIAHIESQGVEKFKGTLPKPPEKYEVKLPEKSILPQTALERSVTIARELGLTSHEHAQKVIDFANMTTAEVVDAIVKSHQPGGDAYKAMVQKWEGEALAAPDLGGGKPEVLQAKVARATAFTNKHFPEAVRSLLNEHGIGSHPDFLRAIVKLADLAKEDSVITGAGGGAGKKSVAERLYGEGTVTPTGATQ